MNPSLLNSIYFKLSEKKIHNLKDLIELYLKSLFVIYLNILDEHNINNLEERIKVRKTLPSGRKYVDTHDAGWYLVNVMFDSAKYEDEIDELNKMFLKNCELPHKDKCLDMVQHLFKEMASESLDKEKIIEEISNLDFSFEHDDEDY